MTENEKSIPSNFTGLIYPPSHENGVYLLMGLLWKHLPYKFAIEEFEIDPKKEGYNHNKHLDAKGKYLADDGEWRDITIEFQLNSSGFNRDIYNNPGVYTDFIICWKHDSAFDKSNVDEVIELKSIFDSLPVEDKHRIILYPNEQAKIKPTILDVQTLLGRFSETNRAKVKLLIDKWPETYGGSAEIIFKKKQKTLFRACSYSRDEHLMVTKEVSSSISSDLTKRFNGKKLKEELRIPLELMNIDDIEEFISIIYGQLSV